MGTQAEPSFPWKRVGVASYRINTSLGDWFSQGGGGILTGRNIAEYLMGFLQQFELLIA